MKELLPTAPSQEHPLTADPNLWTDTGAAEGGDSEGGPAPGPFPPTSPGLQGWLSPTRGTPAHWRWLAKDRVRPSPHVPVLASLLECADLDSFLQITQV